MCDMSLSAVFDGGQSIYCYCLVLTSRPAPHPSKLKRNFHLCMMKNTVFHHTQKNIWCITTLALTTFLLVPGRAPLPVVSWTRCSRLGLKCCRSCAHMGPSSPSNWDTDRKEYLYCNAVGLLGTSSISTTYKKEKRSGKKRDQEGGHKNESRS